MSLLIVASPQSTNLARVLSEVEVFVRRFIFFRSDHQVCAVVLFIAHTHCVASADATPYLHVTSPEKQSGKSRLLEVIELLVSKPWRAVETTESALFRKVSTDQPTLLLDEVDAIFKRDAKHFQGLRAMLNAGHRQGTRVPRSVGQGSQWRAEKFDVLSAKVLAGIGNIPDTIADRSIRIELARRAHGEIVERFRYRDARQQAIPIFDRLAKALGAGDLERLKVARPLIPASLDDRAADGWEPLLAIADLAGGQWPDRARDSATALNVLKSADEEDSYGVRLLRDIAAVFRERNTVFLPTRDLMEALIEIETSPWPAWWQHDFKREAFNAVAAKLAQILKPYGILPKKRRQGLANVRGYHIDDFAEASSRYLNSPMRIPDPEQRNIAGSGIGPDGWAQDANVASNCDVPTFRPDAPSNGGADLNTISQAVENVMFGIPGSEIIESHDASPKSQAAD